MRTLRDTASWLPGPRSVKLTVEIAPSREPVAWGRSRRSAILEDRGTCGPNSRPDDARRFYDRFGSRQDTQGFYENPALDDLVKYTDFEHARPVLEFGCGTGSFARRLSETDLPVKAHYLGLDIKSPPYHQERRAGDQAQRHTASRSQEQSGVNAREAPTTWQAVRSFWRFGGCCFRSSIRRVWSTLEDNEATLES